MESIALYGPHSDPPAPQTAMSDGVLRDTLCRLLAHISCRHRFVTGYSPSFITPTVCVPLDGSQFLILVCNKESGTRKQSVEPAISLRREALFSTLHLRLPLLHLSRLPSMYDETTEPSWCGWGMAR